MRFANCRIIQREASALSVQLNKAMREPQIEDGRQDTALTFLFNSQTPMRGVRRHLSLSMKKFLLGMVAMIATFSFSASAQSVSADFTSLDKLVEKLAKACEKAPKPSGVAEVDAFLDGNVKAALGAVASAEQLHNLYSRQIGETKDGVQDVTVTKPTLEDWTNLAATVVTQTAGLAELGIAGKNAAEAVKGADKMKALKLAKPVKWSTDLMPVTVEALAEEAKAIDQIIKPEGFCCI